MPRPTGNRRPDLPSPGTFKIRLVKGGPWIGARIAFTDGVWSVSIANVVMGENADPWQSSPHMERVWFWGHIIDEAEHAFLCAQTNWAQQHAPEHPSASPLAPIDLTQQRSLF